jgi:hypothetical protein
MEDIVAGNKCLFFLFKIFNILLIVVGITMVGLGIWLAVMIK